MAGRGTGGGGGAAAAVARVVLVAAALGSVAHYRDDVHPANEASRVYAALALADHGTVALEPVFDDLFPGWRAAGRPPNVDVSVVDGGYRLDKAPGLSLMGAPVVAALHAAGWRPGFGTLAWLLALLLCALPSAVFVEVLGRRLRADGVPGAGWVPAAAVLASPWMAYGGLLFGHGAAAAWAGMGLLAALGPLVPDPSRDGRPGLRDAAGAAAGGLALGIAVLVEYPAALLAVLACGALAADPARRRRLPLVLAGALPAAVALLAWNAAAFGSPLAVSYAFKDNAAYHALHGSGAWGMTWPDPGRLLEIVGGSRRGLLFLAPWMATGLAGAVAAARDRTLPRAWRVALGAGIPAWCLWIAGFPDWQAGMSFGPRHLLAGLPLLALGAAVAVRGPRSASTRWTDPVAAGLVASSFALCAAAAWTFPYAHGAVANPVAEVVLPVLAEAGTAPTAWDGWLPRPAGAVLALLAALAVLLPALAARRPPRAAGATGGDGPGAPRAEGGPSAAVGVALALAAAALHLALVTLPRTPDAEAREVLANRALAFEMMGRDDLAAVREGMRRSRERQGP